MFMTYAMIICIGSGSIAFCWLIDKLVRMTLIDAERLTYLAFLWLTRLILWPPLAASYIDFAIKTFR